MSELHSTPACIGLVLAAGAGQRFGSDKRRAQLADGNSLLRATVLRAQEAFSDVRVVITAEDDAQALAIPSGVQLVRTAHAKQGMGSSLAAGIQSLANTQATAVAVLLGDMPWISVATLQQLRAQADAEHIVVAYCEGQRGHPVLFGRRFWPQLMQLQGENGAKGLIATHAQQVITVTLTDSGILRDVDTPAELSHPPIS
ncbi:MAG: nucleotidyltransferase family protein [Gammaproteobacteria bacterium]|nr:nucleotidyltransferase family protein [Gammaproteobacteria bacterium]MBU0884664.1 nucleotidyltransferase family protein [Gammaproteobacteria bacterium]MBU1861714.1 nucleotidyltransferase family protein [Gammaproteobacteria bacterium]